MASLDVGHDGRAVDSELFGELVDRGAGGLRSEERVNLFRAEAGLGLTRTARFLPVLCDRSPCDVHRDAVRLLDNP